MPGDSRVKTVREGRAERGTTPQRHTDKFKGSNERRTQRRTEKRESKKENKQEKRISSSIRNV